MLILGKVNLKLIVFCQRAIPELGWLCRTESKSVQTSVNLNKKKKCPLVTLNNQPILIKNKIKYLGIHLDAKVLHRPMDQSYQK